MTNEFNHKDGVSLEKYFDKRLEDLEKSLCLKIKAVENKYEVTQAMSQTAINKAEDAINERLTVMNEFRAAMKDQQANFISRDMFEASRQSTESKLRTLELDKATLDGKADIGIVMRAEALSNRSFVFSIISAVFGLIGILFGLINILGG